MAEHESSLGAASCKWASVRKGLDPSEVSSLFPWPSLAAGVVLGLMLVAAAGSAATSSSTAESWTLGFLGVLVLLSTASDAALSCNEQRLCSLEMPRRVRHVVNRLRQVQGQVRWSASNYPHLHTPLTASIVLQWALRDRRQVNLPWALLVEGDLIMLKPGQVRGVTGLLSTVALLTHCIWFPPSPPPPLQSAPGRCHSVDKPGLRMRRDEILHIRCHLKKKNPPKFDT